MALRPNMELADYLEILRRRKWLIIFSFLFTLFGAFVYGVVAPEMYKSSTMILVIPQRVPEGYVRSTVSVRIEERLATIQQQVMSRTRLLMVMEELGLFQAERKALPAEQVVDMMRKRIRIQVNSATSRSEGGEAFSLTFVHENPQMAMLTTSRLASFFIDENLKSREQQAVSTAEFLESQLQETKAKLEDQEEKVKQYKLRFSGELPQQLQANLQTLSRLQDQLRLNSDSLRSAQDRKVLVIAQIQSLEAQVAAVDARRTLASRGDVGEAPQTVNIAPSNTLESLVSDLNAKKNQLMMMSAKYTDQHPEIRRLKDEIAQQEKQVAVMRTADPAGAEAQGNPWSQRQAAGGASASSMAPGDVERDEIRRLRAQLTGVDVEINSLRSERVQIQKSISDIEARVEKSPRREQEMISLTRDYENLKTQYDEMLKKKLDAEVAQNLEKRQKGEQFQILDPANLPQEPFTPDRKRILVMAVFASFLFGFGGAIGLEMVNPTLRGRNDFKHLFGLHVLGAIPEMRNESYGRKVLIRRAVVTGGFVIFFAAVAIFLLIQGDKARAVIHRLGG